MPHFSATETNRKFMREDDMKYDGIESVDEQGAASGFQQHVSGLINPISSDYQHEWYRQMYKKLHKIPKPEGKVFLYFFNKITCALFSFLICNTCHA